MTDEHDVERSNFVDAEEFDLGNLCHSIYGGDSLTLDEVEEGDDIENNEDNESPEEFSERYEDDWVDGDGDDSVAMEVGDDK